MDSTTDEVPAKRVHVEVREKTQIPQETMLEVLLWLDRFDLDGKQITTRRLRCLVENKQMPLRKVDRVDYDGEERRYLDPSERPTLNIRLEDAKRDRPDNVALQIETDADAEKAASYLSSCFVSDFNVYGHREVLPRNAIIAAPALIRVLDFQECNFGHGEADTLGATLNGSNFEHLALEYSSVPAWQINDKRLEVLRNNGCNWVNLYPDDMEPYDDDQKFKVTEEGILAYCFTLDADLPMPERRYLGIMWVNVTPAFFKKVVEASKNSRLTCDVELMLEHLQFDVGNLDVGVLPSRSHESEIEPYEEIQIYNVRYNFADHGNGIRLFIHFKSNDGEKWEVVVRHAKKDHGAFFGPTSEVEEFNEEDVIELSDSDLDE